MIDPQPLMFAEGWADREFTGCPLIESVLCAFVGRCQACGRPAEQQWEGSVLVNPGHIDGTLYGDTFCAGCYDDRSEGIVFVLPPLEEPPEGRGE